MKKILKSLLFAVALQMAGAVLPAIAQEEPVEAALPRPPQQPPGFDYNFSYSEGRLLGSGATQVIIFTPKGATGQSKLPVVVFLHDWGAKDPAPYIGWIDHIVRRNAIVIYPVYQETLNEAPSALSENALAGTQAAFATLNKTGPFPDADRIAVAGHGMGGVIAANLVSMAGNTIIPPPRALVSVMPGKTESLLKEKLIPLEDMSAFSNLILLTMAGDEDVDVGDHDARRIVAEATNVAADHKMMLVMHSDDRGKPALSADHMAPLAPDAHFDISELRQIDDDSMDRRVTGQRVKQEMQQQRRYTQVPRRAGSVDAPRDRMQAVRDARTASRGKENQPASVDFSGGEVDALDWFGFWKTLDLTIDAAFSGKTALDLAADPSLVDMGQWSDGTPVRKMQVVWMKPADVAPAAP